MIRRSEVFLSIVMLGIGLVATLWGISHLIWPDALVFNGASINVDSGLRRFVATLIATPVLTLVIRHLLRCSVYAAGLVLFVAVALMSDQLWPMVAVIAIFCSFAIVGRLLVVSVFGNVESDWTLATLVGAAFFGTAVGIFAHFPINYPAIYAVVLFLPIAVAGKTRRQFFDILLSTIRAHRADIRVSVFSGVLALSTVTVTFIHAVVALMPELGHDALVTHLFVPAHMASRHEWGFDVSTYVWAVMPFLGDWLYSIAYMLGGETAARLTNLGFIFITCYLIGNFARWMGGTSKAAAIAVLVFLSTPLTFTESSSLFIESVWTAFLLAGALEIMRASTLGKPASAERLYMIGLLLGAALASKAITLACLPGLLTAVLFRPKVFFALPALPNALKGVALMLIVGGIPYVTAHALTGNPVFPFFNEIFQSPYYPAVNFEAPDIFRKGVRWDLLYEITFNSQHYLEAKSGAAGFHWLLLLLPTAVWSIFARRYRILVLLALGIVWLVFIFHSTAYLRYVFPTFALTAAVIGVGIGDWYEVSRKLYCAAVTVLGGAVALNIAFLNAGGFYADFPIQTLYDRSTRQAYLRERLPLRNAIELVNHLNIHRSPVAIFSPPLTAGLTADGLYPNWYNPRFESEVATATTAEALSLLLWSRGVDYLVLDTSWGDGKKRAIIEAQTEKISDIGTISVRRLSKSARFRKELIDSVDFSDSSKWRFVAGRTDQEGPGIVVDIAAPVYQQVPVRGGQRYLNAVRARCLKDTAPGRLQVNWVDAQSKFISADIRLFECTPESSEYEMEIAAPRNAAYALVYASGHTVTPLVFERNSFLQ